MSTPLYRMLLAAVVLLMLGSARVNGTVFIASNDWDYAPVPNNWVTSYYANATTSVPVTGGNTGHFLQVTFPENIDPFNTTDQIIWAPATNFFTGAFNESMWASFDFWSSNTTAQGLKLVIQSGTNENYWSYAFSPLTSNGWVSYGAGFTFPGWVGFDPGMTEEQFLADLQSISWIGIFIQRSSYEEQIYGIDNFMLWVPEPGEWLLIITALIVCAWAERRRRNSMEPAWACQSGLGPTAPS